MTESVLTFLEQRVEKVDFWLNEDYVERDEDINVSMSFSKSIKRLAEPDRALLNLELRIFDGTREKNYPFYLHVSVSGLFGLSSMINSGEFDKLIKVNAVAILFPYVRSLVTNITASAGIRPLLLPLINVVAIFEEQEKTVKSQDQPKQDD